jgi:hypothetical protein
MQQNQTEQSLLSALLIDAPVGRHFAQLHREAGTLAKAVGLYMETGLRRGNGVVVIATPEHSALFLQHLETAGIAAEEARRTGQLGLFDADELLAEFMRAGMPDWAAFRKVIGSVLDRMQVFGRNATRAYGEMVNVLWRQGNTKAAICLEEYWNELARLYPFSLFCCYTMDSHDSHGYGGPLHDIERTHSDIVTTEEDARFCEALEAASKDVFGLPLSELVVTSPDQASPAHGRLPAGQRAMLWIMENLPHRSATVLELARRHYEHRRATREPAGVPRLA